MKKTLIFLSKGFDEAYSEVLHKIAQEFRKQDKPIATLCVCVLPLSDAGLMKDKKATTYNLSRYHNNPRHPPSYFRQIY